MANKLTFCILFAIVVIATIVNEQVDARYLPTRSKTDKLDKLKELLKELLESEIETNEYYDSQPRWHPESKLFYKREAKAQ